MFTGLIQTLGKLHPQGGDQFQVLCLQGPQDPLLQDLAIGDSVAVDGVCLTVEQILPQGFVASASPETLRRTSLGQDQAAPVVNLESSLRVGSKLGGHFVTGHVDGMGCLEAVEQTENSWELRFQAPPPVARYILEKGSIAVNGISLTVAQCDRAGSWFTVSVIPVTYRETNLRYLQPGMVVNLEGDILGKYVEKFLSPATATSQTDWMTPEFLAEHGYLA